MNCEKCGQFFSGTHNQKFCTEECRKEARRKRRGCVEGVCLICNSEIDRANRAGTIYCSKKCREKSKADKNTCPEIAKKLLSKLVITEDKGIAFIVSKGGEEAIVDASLAGWLSQWPWVIDKKGYPRYSSVTMHYVLKTLWGWADMVCDHKDRNKLNNTKDNLRPCTMTENSSNSGPRNKASGLKGVHRTASGKWQAMIWHEGKNVGLGSFDTCREAAQVYNTKALELKGEFAFQNVI